MSLKHQIRSHIEHAVISTEGYQCIIRVELHDPNEPSLGAEATVDAGTHEVAFFEVDDWKCIASLEGVIRYRLYRPEATSVVQRLGRISARGFTRPVLEIEADRSWMIRWYEGEPQAVIAAKSRN